MSCMTGFSSEWCSTDYGIMRWQPRLLNQNGCFNEFRTQGNFGPKLHKPLWWFHIVSVPGRKFPGILLGLRQLRIPLVLRGCCLFSLSGRFAFWPRV